MKQLAYVSGKYRDLRGAWYVEQNIRRAEEVASELWQMGYAVICPHTNTRHMDGPISAEDFIDGDLVMVERSDLIVMLPEWQESEGARMEHHMAVNKGIPIYYWEADQWELEKQAKRSARIMQQS